MAEVLCVYRKVEVLKRAAAGAEETGKPVAIVSYDEKPGIQAIATTSPDLPPVPGVHPTFARDHEYKRHGTCPVCWRELICSPARSTPLSRIAIAAESSSIFSSFSMPLIRPAPPLSSSSTITRPTYPRKPKRGSPLARPAASSSPSRQSVAPSSSLLIEGFFSKFARSVLRHIRVTSKQELKERIMAGIKYVNRRPVVHTWSYRLTQAV